MAGLTLFVVLALPVGERTRIDVVAQAKAALDPTSGVLHMVVTLRSGPSPTPRLTRYSNGETLRYRWLEIQTERWSTNKPLRYRQTTQQQGFSDATRRDESYADRRFSRLDGNLIRTSRVSQDMADTLNEGFASETGFSALGPIQGDPVAKLREFFEAGSVRVAGETTVAGRRVLRLVSADQKERDRQDRIRHNAPGISFPKEYLVDATTYAPVRATYVFPASLGDPVGPNNPYITSTLTFSTFERLPTSPESLAQLDIPTAGRQVINDPRLFKPRKVRFEPPRNKPAR